jgi:4-amino-4-deoxy-L-arabinose transferase-like glycosyltransferase
MQSDSARGAIVLLGAALICAVAWGLALVPARMERARRLKVSFWLSAIVGTFCAALYLLLVWGYRNDLSKLGRQEPLILLGAAIAMAAVFVSDILKSLYFDWLKGLVNRRASRAAARRRRRRE